jgi:hypothetical protein
VTESLESVYFNLGAIVGVMLTGIAVDLWLSNKKFLMIFILNTLLLVSDIYLFCTADANDANNDTTSAGAASLSLFLGAILQSSDLIYLILLPMFIAKKHSEKMSHIAQFQKLCFSGTIVGVTLASCFVGKYLISANLASLLNFSVSCSSTTDCNKQIAFSDVITLALLFLSNLTLWTCVKRELFARKHSAESFVYE